MKMYSYKHQSCKFPQIFMWIHLFRIYIVGKNIYIQLIFMSMWSYSSLIRHKKQFYPTNATSCGEWPGFYKWDLEDHIKKQTDMPKPETEAKHARFWQKGGYPPLAILQRMFLMLPAGILLQVFIDISIPSTFSFYQLVGSHVWSLPTKEFNVNSLTHRSHSCCLSCWNVHWPVLSKRFRVDRWRGKNKIKRKRPIKRCCGWYSKE